jgi:hypothetical protein
MGPLSKITALRADIIHAGDRGWFYYKSDGMYAHVPGDDPIFTLAICVTKIRHAFDGTAPCRSEMTNDKRDSIAGEKDHAARQSWVIFAGTGWSSTSTDGKSLQQFYMFYSIQEVELALGLAPPAAPIDAPIVQATYGDTTFNLMDCREYLGDDPTDAVVYTQLRHAMDAYDVDGIMVPLTRVTAKIAEILHVGDRGWYFYVRGTDGMWAHVPGEEPLFRTAATFSGLMYAIDGTGYAVVMKPDLYEGLSGDRSTSLVRYRCGIVDPL